MPTETDHDIPSELVVLFCFMAGLVGFAAGMIAGNTIGDDLSRGRCIGWAEAQGLIPAWDEDGECVLGMYPAGEE